VVPVARERKGEGSALELASKKEAGLGRGSRGGKERERSAGPRGGVGPGKKKREGRRGPQVRERRGVWADWLVLFFFFSFFFPILN
jgi:hypothetical protein